MEMLDLGGAPGLGGKTSPGDEAGTVGILEESLAQAERLQKIHRWPVDEGRQEKS